MNPCLNSTYVVICLLAAHQVEAQIPTGSELLRQVPNLSNEGKVPQSFSLKSTCLTHDEIPTEIAVCWREDGRYSLILSDASTHTPIACFSQNGFAIYNALKRTITFGPEVQPKFRFFSNSKSNIEIDLSWSRPDVRKPDPVLFSFDLSTFANPDRLSVKKSQDGNRFVVTCPSPSGMSNTTWEFDADSERVFRRFAITRKEDGTQMVHIDDVKTGKGVSTILAPTNVPEGTTLRGNSWNPDGMPSFAEFLTTVFDAIGGHAALTNPKYRQMKAYGQITDWTSVVNQSQLDRPFVVQLFSVPSEYSE